MANQTLGIGGVANDGTGDTLRAASDKVNDNFLEIYSLLGTGTLLIEPKLTYGGCKMGHIENILIDEKYRGKGYGENLVNKLLEISKNEKCYRVDLNCTPELNRFYKKMNFKKKYICMNLYFKENFI